MNLLGIDIKISGECCSDFEHSQSVHKTRDDGFLNALAHLETRQKPVGLIYPDRNLDRNAHREYVQNMHDILDFRNMLLNRLIEVTTIILEQTCWDDSIDLNLNKQKSWIHDN